MIIAWKIRELFEGLNFDGGWVLSFGGLFYKGLNLKNENKKSTENYSFGILINFSFSSLKEIIRKS